MRHLVPSAIALTSFFCTSLLMSQTKPATRPAPDPATAWERIQPFFAPPPEFQGVLGNNRNPLQFNDGSIAKTPEDWKRRRQEILDTWTRLTGAWPKLLEQPALDITRTERRENFTQHTVSVEAAAGRKQAGYLLVPDGPGPFPAVLVVYYEPETSVGLKGENRDFARQLTRRGFITLSIGSVNDGARNPKVPVPDLQPLSYLAYAAANCHTALAQRKEVDPARIGVVGHSFGGKWAMFASALHDKFAAAVWCDPDLVFDEEKSNANYWETWYLGREGDTVRTPGIPSKDNPRIGAYKKLIENNHDLTEIHALMAPRPVLVSGGAEDPPYRWKALNHLVAVNKLLGHENRVALTSRPEHGPNEEALEQINDFFDHFLKVAPLPKRNE